MAIEAQEDIAPGQDASDTINSPDDALGTKRKGLYPDLQGLEAVPLQEEDNEEQEDGAEHDFSLEPRPFHYENRDHSAS